MKIFNPEVEKTCIIGLKNGEIDSFEILYSYYKPLLVLYALRYLKNKEITEELIQDVFLNVWENRIKINENLSFKSYLFTITKNKITDFFRKQKVENLYQSYVQNYMDMVQDSSLKDVIYKDFQRNLAEAVDQLPEKRRMIFIMSKKLELTRNEIAQYLKISENTVKNQLQEALKFLREILGNEFSLLIIILVYTTL